MRPSAQAPITVGGFCSIGPDILIFGQAAHPVDMPSTSFPHNWDWPDEKIRSFDAEFYGPVEAFIARARG